MKIGMIVKKLNVKGGTQRQMLSLARELKRRGHEVVVYTFAYDKEKCYPELLADMHVVVAPTGEVHGTPEYYRDVRFLKRGQLGAMLRENRRAKLLARTMDRNLDLLNPHDQVSYRVAHYYKKYVRRIPSVWNMNDLPLYRFGYDKMREVDQEFQRPFLRRLFYRLYDAYDAHFIRTQDRIVVVDFFNRGLVKKYVGLSAITVRNGPDLEHFSYKQRTPPQPPHIKLLTSGIFLPHRRFEDVIRAVKLLEAEGLDPQLTIIGDYENDRKYHAKLVGLVHELGVAPRVRMTGRVSEKELVEAYHANDLYLFPHHWQSDGLSPFEAAACGMPILVSRTAGSHELLTDRENGVVLEPKNPEDITKKVRELLENPKLYTKLSANGNRFVRENFSWQKYTDDVLKVFAKVCS
ncbi:glycosyltransferase family 4 protein [Candidatus Uhrbacteria bacterium]|nr:glycosyltransferase family 4 protein [Candidatus Uhrbacteria bacterium]